MLCSHSKGDFFTCEDNMLFSHVKISSFRAKAHLVFHWCLYNKVKYSIAHLSTVSDLTNQIMTPESGVMDGWHQNSLQAPPGHAFFSVFALLHLRTCSQASNACTVSLSHTYQCVLVS